MKRAILGAALVPVAAVACGYGLARQMARYFNNPLDVLDRIGQETNDYVDQMIAAGMLGPSPDSVLQSAPSPIPNEGSTTS